jgi:hypothetical protein
VALPALEHLELCAPGSDAEAIAALATLAPTLGCLTRLTALNVHTNEDRTRRLRHEDLSHGQLPADVMFALLGHVLRLPQLRELNLLDQTTSAVVTSVAQHLPRLLCGDDE